MIKHNSDILNKLFFRELQMLIEKYNKINESDKERIESIVTNLKDEELQSYLMRNMDKLLNILKCTDEIDEDVVTFFVWYNFQITEITIGIARECVKELKENKYLEIGEHLIYQDEKHLKDYARDVLEDRLGQEYYVDKLFDKENIIEMWIEGITKEQIIQEIVDNDNLEEVLEIYPQYAFTIDGISYKYSQVE
ncbi:MAG: hypothetical protein SOR73_14045 [Romboutsia timonensis]|uniref:hypothetical protein n=1 Tax=Romboutsia timonensis TaxID=1776391 RepID=UPI002A763845|nr:hypothetical protein [Romboutsia timonensis]MDY3002779.1 hypothetical protein [Romboutsia timonensis]